MNKKELTIQVAKTTGLTAEVASKVIDAVFGAIKEGLKKGETTTIIGFGSFMIKNCAARNGINPGTKQPIKIPARKAVKFSASKNIEIK